MKLSMWIFKDWLRDYSPEPEIQNGKCIIQNVRLFSEQLRFSSSTVYLMPMEEEKIVCSNGNDILTLHCDDVNEILNRILDAFDYYNDCENQMLQAIEADCSIEELMKQFSMITHHLMIFADATFYMRAFFAPDTILSAHPQLKDLLRTRMLPLSALQALNQSSSIRKPDLPAYPVSVPAVGSAIVSNLFTGGLHAGWLIADSADNTYTEGQTDLHGQLAELLCRWLARNRSTKEHTQKAGLFLDILNGEQTDPRQIDLRLRSFGWSSGDRLTLYVLKPLESSTFPPTVLFHHLEAIHPAAFVLFYQNHLLELVNHDLTDQTPFRREFTDLLTSVQYCAGASPSFRRPAQLPDEFRAASIAAEYAPKIPGAIQDFPSALLPYLLTLLQEHSVTDLRHPALSVLKTYDQTHHTELSHTLHCYLTCRCNATETARSLYIHRSTLLYRIDRILGLTGIDFENPDEYFHLLLSFYLDAMS